MDADIQEVVNRACVRPGSMGVLALLGFLNTPPSSTLIISGKTEGVGFSETHIVTDRGGPECE